MSVLNWFSRKQGIILNYSVLTTRPKAKIANKARNYEHIAIVIQGPIQNSKFLASVIDFYSVNFNRVKIYVSTWKNEKGLYELDSKYPWNLIQSERPTSSGISNINLQAITTLRGLEHARYDGCQYVLKIRSDQGLFASNFLDQFLFAFENAPTSGQSRIVTTDFNSFLFRQNSPSDQIQFATTLTLINFWSSYKFDNEHEGGFPEEILLGAYLKSMGHKIPSSLEESLKIYRDFFVFLDSSDLGLVWRKGSWRHPDSRFEQLDRSSQLRFVSPDEWRRLHTDLKSVLTEAQETRSPKE